MQKFKISKPLPLNNEGMLIKDYLMIGGVYEVPHIIDRFAMDNVIGTIKARAEEMDSALFMCLQKAASSKLRLVLRHLNNKKMPN